MSMNDHFMEGSETYAVEGFIDSGTTITYFPEPLWNTIKSHFEQWFCPNSDHNCLGEVLSKNNNRVICFKYDQTLFPDGPYLFFASYPVLKLKLKNTDGDFFELIWYPSEYLYKYTDGEYCFAAESQAGT